ncbi:DUF805 domain-containing protein [Streptomyces sp. NPDC048639]|uniref:DUF805 domain-containing protein n=1 Tax=Streptomyces sp. NPDC048639 TaxID=3365581 RepID=UPI0037104616
MHWYIDPFKNALNFRGRARRKSYWMFRLLSACLAAVVYIADIEADTGPFLFTTYCLIILLPTLALICRRLHDTGRSGVWAFFLLLPGIGELIILVFALQDSQPGTNAYGPNPKEASVPA